MEDTPATIVLHSEANEQGTMNDTLDNPDPDRHETSQTDEQLMVEFARGSSNAFDALFRRYRQPLFGFFRRRVTDPSQAEELTQETFLVVLRAASKYEACALFRTYLYAIGFKILRAYRRKAAFRSTYWGQQPEGREPATPGTLDTEMLIRQAVGKLDRMQREILMLREFEQLSYAEIAELTHLPLNTVRSRLFRAREALHDLLAEPTPKSDPSEVVESEGRS
jgi:RNA polymerase sigma-70 factor (ECF subfamily)